MTANEFREGWIHHPAPGGGYIGWPANARPSITPNHIDGPLLVLRNGELHWLTIWERLLFGLKLADAYSLERKHRPCLKCDGLGGRMGDGCPYCGGSGTRLSYSIDAPIAKLPEADTSDPPFHPPKD